MINARLTIVHKLIIIFSLTIFPVQSLDEGTLFPIIHGHKKNTMSGKKDLRIVILFRNIY